MVHPYNERLLRNTKEQCTFIYATTWINLIMLSEMGPDAKDSVLYDSIYMKFKRRKI